MKMTILKNCLYTFAVLSYLTSCRGYEIDNYKSRYESSMELTTSADTIYLNEQEPDSVALTLEWTPAMDYGWDYTITYEYGISVSESKSQAISEYEDAGNFSRSYTNKELQDKLVDEFEALTSSYYTMKFTVDATFTGPRLIMPEQSTANVIVKTYGPKQFKADKVFIAGTAVGSAEIELSPKSDNEEIFIYEGPLSTGTVYFPVNYFDEVNAISPISGTDTDVTTNTQLEATMVDKAETHFWNVTEADTYRVTINFETETVTFMKAADILEVDKIYLAGTAATGTDMEVTQTLENENVYAFYGVLNAGKLYLPIEFGGSRSKAIVPNAEGSHDINDGITNIFSQADMAKTDEKYWEIPSAGEYRIVVDIEMKEITIYSEATDMQPKMVGPWKDTTVPNQETGENFTWVTTPVEYLWMWGNFDLEANRNVPSDKYRMEPSKANPYIFTYSGALNTGSIKFLVSNKWNNVYAFGAGEGDPNKDTFVDVELGATCKMVGGQLRNRYCFFNIPEGTNFIVVNITDDANPTVIFSKK